MKVVGCSYIFKTNLPYCKDHNRKVVTVVAVGDIVSKVKTEEGQTFAAFNNELTRDTRDLEFAHEDY